MGLLSWHGQSAAIARLQLALAHDRRHHCYIFHGPAGVGKAGIAADFARVILCEKPLKRTNHEFRLPLLAQDAGLLDGCGECPTCRQTAAGTHPDLNFVLREPGRTSISVKVIAESLLEKAHVKSAGGRLKAFIIPEAERIQEAGWNKLLKTLEEPPPHTMIVLSAPSLDHILPTILSRAQLVKFAPLPVPFVEKLLREKHGIDPGPAAFLARFTGGSPGESIRRAKTGLYQIKRELVDRLAVLDESEVFNLVDSMLEFARTEPTAEPGEDGDADEPAERAGSAPAGEGEGGEAAAGPAGEVVRTNLRIVLGLAADFFRDVLVIQSGGDPALPVHVDQIEAVRRAAGRMSSAAATRAIRELALADARTAQFVLPQLALDAAVGELGSRE
jgi:DNA polymerase-3 subunit delta'